MFLKALLIHPGQIKDYAPQQVCVLISGTQGEPMSALSRAAVDNHKHAKIERGDTVVLSSRIIPGNEKGIYRMIDHLYRREADVIYDDGSNSAGPRERTRQPGRAQADHEPGQAEIFYPGAR